MLSGTLQEFHHIGMEGSAHHSETLKSSSLGQCLKFLFSSLFPTWVVSQHDAVNVDHCLGGEAVIWRHRKNAFCYYHLPIWWQRIVTILQEF